MTARASAAARRSFSLGRVYKNGAHSSPKLLYLNIPGGVVFSILPGFLLSIKYVGFPAKPDPAILSFAFWTSLPVGLLLTDAVSHADALAAYLFSGKRCLSTDANCSARRPVLATDSSCR